MVHEGGGRWGPACSAGHQTMSHTTGPPPGGMHLAGPGHNHSEVATITFSISQLRK